MAKINITLADKSAIITAKTGDNVMQLLRDNGYHIAAYCGGNGSCGKCIISIDGVAVKACHSTISGDCDIVIPHSNDAYSICATGGGEGASVDAYAESSSITCASINGNCTSGCSSVIMPTITHVDYAVDLGTTTIAVVMISDSGEILQSTLNDNKQSVYGADVISRIKHCSEGKFDRLHDIIISQLNNIMSRMNMSVGNPSVGRIVVSGNTTMIHILMNVDCSSMGVAPYTPIFVASRAMIPQNIGIKLGKQLITVPSISAFVGGDIVSGIYQAGVPSHGRYNMLIDIGTNAEIAIYNADKCYCTAAAAGSCFEGASIKCGTSATSGAISGYKIISANSAINSINNQANTSSDNHKTAISAVLDYDGGEACCLVQTIDNAPPIGICGSGLIDIISELVSHGIIDETGRFADGDSYHISGDVYLYQQDIREFQLAKSALRAGVESLMQVAGLSNNDIDKVYLAGGFAMHFDINNAVTVGMISSELASKSVIIGNSSLNGAIKYLATSHYSAINYPASSYIDLTSEGSFSDMFIDYMTFEN